MLVPLRKQEEWSTIVSRLNRLVDTKGTKKFQMGYKEVREVLVLKLWQLLESEAMLAKANRKLKAEAAAARKPKKAAAKKPAAKKPKGKKKK